MAIAGQFKSAYEIPSFYLGALPANIDMSGLATNPSKQYQAVDVGAATGAGILEPAALIAVLAAGGKSIGILQNNPQLGEAGSVMVHGVSKALLGAGGATVGAVLAVDASGNLVAAASGNYGVAVALQAGASGQVIAVLLLQLGKQ